MTSGASPEVLLQGLAMFLGQTVRPAVSDKGTAFRVRIAQHLAMSLALQLGREGECDQQAVDRLTALLDADPDTTTPSALAASRQALEEQLAVGLRDGTLDISDEVVAHIRQSLADELSWTNPRFDLSGDLP